MSVLLVAACSRGAPGEPHGPEADTDDAADLEPLPAALDHRVVTYLQQYGRNWPEFGFHGVVLVARGDEVSVHRAFGSADLTAGVANDTSTRFRVGTLSGQLVAAAAMILVDRGVLTTDDTLAHWRPDWPGGEAITVEHLLTHGSGIPSFTDGEAFTMVKHVPRTSDDLLASIRGLPLDFTPGTDVSPSNANPVVLAAIVERASGTDLAAFVQREILDPLQMTSTSWATTDAQQAIGMQFNEGEYLEPVHGVHPGAFGAAGAYLSTAHDLWRFNRALAQRRLLSEVSTQRTLGQRESDMGYGWITQHAFGRRIAGWPGLIDGFNASVLHVADDETVVIVLANTEVVSAGQIAMDVLAMVYGEPMPKVEEARAVPVPLDTQRVATGAYRLTAQAEQLVEAAAPDQLESLQRVRISAEAQWLTLDVPIHGRKRMHPLGDGRFFFKDLPRTTARVVARADGTGRLWLAQAGGVELEYVRVPE